MAEPPDVAGDEVAAALRRLRANMPSDIQAAHAHCKRNRVELLDSTVCGCFYCLAIFAPDEISDWLEDGFGISDAGVTALCPHCGIDSVIGDRSGFPVTEEFLRTMHAHWF